MSYQNVTGTGKRHHPQALQYNNITVPKTIFALQRYSYSITFLKSKNVLDAIDQFR